MPEMMAQSLRFSLGGNGDVVVAVSGFVVRGAKNEITETASPKRLLMAAGARRQQLPESVSSLRPGDRLAGFGGALFDFA